MMELEKTEGNNPIEFDSWITGPTGARFALFPIINLHDDEDVKVAKRYLYSNRDVISLQVRWKGKEDKTENPEKIPDYIIIKNLKIDIGKSDSYIIELESKVKTLEKELEIANSVNITSQDKHEIKREILYQQQNKFKKELELKIKKLIKDKQDLIIRLNQPK